MPRATIGGATNAAAGVYEPVDPNLMPVVMEALATGDPSQIGPAEHAQPDELDRQIAEEESEQAEQDEQEEKEETSAGTSSSTSGDKQDKSGDPTGTDHQSPAPDAQNPSELHLTVQAEASSAHSTGGSTQETGSDPASPPDSSEARAQTTEPVPADAQAERKSFAEENPQQADS